MQYKICHLTSVHHRYDSRIFFKEASSIADNGYETYLIVADGLGNEINSGVKIIDSGKPNRSRTNRMLKTTWKIYEEALKVDAHIYHFHDPELIPIGLLLRINGKKVIYDAHENITKQIMIKSWIKPWCRKLIAISVKKIENYAVKRFDAVIAVTPEIVAQFPNNKAHLVRNFVRSKSINAVQPVSYDKKGKTIIGYPGTLSMERGTADIIKALDYLPDNVELWLFGKWGYKGFKRYCESLKGWERTKYFGLLPPGKLYGYLKQFDIGLHMVHSVAQYQDGIYPVKAFEYMACGIPFIISDMPSKRKVFSECALFVKPSDPKDIAEKINTLLNSKKLREKLGKKGKQLIDAEYSWENELNNLLKIYQKIIK